VCVAAAAQVSQHGAAVCVLSFFFKKGLRCVE
jgi:hypothetical protein